MADEHDPEYEIEHTVDDLEERTELLEEHLDEAREMLAERQQEARRLGAAEDVAGNFEDADDPAGGDDPTGAPFRGQAGED